MLIGDSSGQGWAGMHHRSERLGFDPDGRYPGGRPAPHRRDHRTAYAGTDTG